MNDAEYFDLLVKHGMSVEEIEHYQENGFSLEEVHESFSNCKRVATAAADFGEDKTTFAWFPYIPIGDYTVLMADGGTGKTILCCGIASAISNGERLPGDIFQNTTPSNVLIISAEDRGELLKKRLAASGADLQKVFILDCMASEGMDFTDGYSDFMDTIQRYAPRLVIIDP